MVYRNPLNSAIAEFNRQRFNQVTGFTKVSAFLKAASKTDGKKHNLTNLYQDQLSIAKLILSVVLKSGKPALVISYEDLKSNTLVQLMRIAHFVGLDNDEDVLERSLCTLYSEYEIANQTKRSHKEDFTQAALSILGREKVLKDIDEMNEIFKSSQLHYLELDKLLKF